ncbi:inner membrane complex protein 1b, putative [Plasmodium sp. DRC-Itaito]|uniref:Inner membrane complex protein 1b, putative n=1 Tax=Plasmodium gaboni TaxID=647221 RepID=A0ABY1UQ68_9APIC|nr:inner membrane complex protein 1b, putative [Plasmodium gaboni]SOV23491.1 inner membrane complex protein 1b, putative [Plasmodium sp. DRC-Itaito]
MSHYNIEPVNFVNNHGRHRNNVKEGYLYKNNLLKEHMNKMESSKNCIMVPLINKPSHSQNNFSMNGIKSTLINNISDENINEEKSNYQFEYRNKIIEVPELKFVDKVVYDPVIIEKIKYVPKDVIKYNIIKKPVLKNIVTEKKVDILQVKEKISFKDKEIVEEVYNYVDKDLNTKWCEAQSDNEIYKDLKKKNYIGQNHLLPNNINIMENNNDCTYKQANNITHLLEPFGPQIDVEENKIIENVFVPNVEKVIEVNKQIDIPINLPVPYIVPKPKIIDVDVPVFKFNDKYVPVPVSKKIIPKITWTDKTYQVDCLIEKPYLVYHNIIKMVPVDAKINVREYPKGIKKINPEELYEVDNLALWMRVNADLKQEQDQLKNEKYEKYEKYEKNKKNGKGQTEELDDNISSDHTCECSESYETYGKLSNEEFNSSNEDTTIKSSNENIFDTLPLHPGHPLEFIHLQNKWINQDTTNIPDMYDQKYLDAHRNAVFNLTTQVPREVEIEAKQLLHIQKKLQQDEIL